MIFLGNLNHLFHDTTNIYNTRKLAIQILYLYHYLFKIYNGLNTKYDIPVKLYSELWEWDCNDDDICLYNIPISLCNKYISIINPNVSKTDATIYDCLDSRLYLILNGFAHNAVYIYTTDFSYVVLFYPDFILVVNLSDLIVYRTDDFMLALEYITIDMLPSDSHNTLFNYVFVHVSKNNRLFPGGL